MASFVGYSLWLSPPAAEAVRLNAIIASLAKKYSTMIFEPHITLFAGVRGDKDVLVEKTRELAKRLKPFTVDMKKVDVGDSYFQCVLASVEEDADGVMKANSIAEEVFAGFEKHPRAFHPHLSLMYGDLPMDQRREICADVMAAWSTVSFDVKEISIHFTDGPCDQWYKVAEFQL